MRLLSVLLFSAGAVSRSLLDVSTPEVTDVAPAESPLSSLALRVVSSTPLQLLSNSPSTEPVNVSIHGTQPLQAVYSRPVIPLGADPEAAAPFDIECTNCHSGNLSANALGSFRWVTTYVARFDPTPGAWPTDLDVAFTWKHDVTTWDGVALETDNLQNVVLQTPSLQLSTGAATSETAAEATNGAWNPFWDSDDVAELPEDGVLQLVLQGSPVAPDLFQNAVKVVTARSQEVTDATATVVPCPEPDFQPLPSFGRKFEPQPTPSPTLCVTLSGLSGSQSYRLLLPAGSRYSEEGGPLRSAQTSDAFTGLLPFTIPLPTNSPDARPGDYSDYEATDDNIPSRRLELYLPHGYSDATTAEDLAARLLLQRLSSVAGDREPTENVPFDVELLDGAFAHVTAQLLANAVYSLSVLPVGDGGDGGVESDELLGSQPLETATDNAPDTATFRTPSPHAVFDAGSSGAGVRVHTIDLQALPASLLWPVLAQQGSGSNGSDVWTAAAVRAGGTDAASVRHVLGELTFSTRGQAVAPPDGAEAVTRDQALTPAPREPRYHKAAELNLSGFLSGGGTALLWSNIRMPFDDRSRRQDVVVVQATEVSVSLLQTGETFLIWAVSSGNGAGISGVEVVLHSVEFDFRTEESIITSSKTASTGGRGFAYIAVPTGGGDAERDPEQEGSTRPASPGQLVAEVTTPNGQVIFVDMSRVFIGNQLFELALQSLQGALILDRSVVGPEHVLHVSGYVRDVTSTVDLVTTDTITARVRFCGQACADMPIELDNDFGSFMLRKAFNESVISALRFGVGAVTLQVCAGPPEMCGETEWRTLDSARLTIADPRPPTAELSLQVPRFVSPGEPIAVTGAVQSLLGADVANANVSIAWSVHAARAALGTDNHLDDVEQPPSGALEVTTMTDGAFETELDLSELESEPGPGTTVTFTAEYIGPTRERIEQRASTALRYSANTVTLTTSNSEDLPLSEFAVTAAVGGPAVDRVEVTVYQGPVSQELCTQLQGCDQGRFEPPSPREGFFSSSFVPALRDLNATEQDLVLSVSESICAVSARDANSWSACRTSLPGVGIYAVTACIGAGQQRTCQAELRGKLHLEWDRAPLDAFPLATWQWAPDSTDSGYAVGTEAKMQLENPVEAANAVIVWRSADDSGVKLTSGIAAGMATLSFTVPAACSSGCVADIVLSWPRLQAPFTAAPVPTHPAFDAAAPSFMRATPRSGLATVPVAVQSTAVNVTVEVFAGDSVAERDDGADSAFVVPPGGLVTLRLGVEECTRTAVSCGVDERVAPDYGDGGGYSEYGDTAYGAEDVAGSEAVAGDGAEGPGAADGCGNATVTECGPLTAPVQVLVVAVDKAWLELQAYAQRDLGAAFNTAQLSTGAFAHSLADFLPPPLLDLWRQKNDAVLAADPWARLMTLSDLHVNVSDWLTSQYYEFYDRGGSVAFRGGGAAEAADSAGAGGVAARAASAPPAGAAAEGGQDSGQGAAVVREVSPADVTPLFQNVRVAVVDGSASQGRVSFRAPATLSTYTVRAYAVSAAGNVFGAADEQEVIVRRTVSLTPAVPRFVRIGDNATVGVVVTLAGSASAAAPVTVAVDVDASGAGAIVGTASKSVTFDGSASTAEVRFDLTATAVGAIGVEFTALRDDAEDAADALSLAIESQLPAAPVTLASSFAVSPGSGWQDGLALPDAFPGTGDIQLYAGVGNLPAQLAIARRVLAATPRDVDTSPLFVRAPWALSVLASHAALAVYGADAFGVPVNPAVADAAAFANLGVGGNATFCEAFTAAVDFAAFWLDAMTNTNGLGLMYIAPNAFPGWTLPRTAETRLNLEARAGVNAIVRLRGETDNPDVCARATSVSDVVDLSDVWLKAGTARLITVAAQQRTQRRPAAYANLSNLLHLWLAHTYEWDPRPALRSVDAAALRRQVSQDISLNRLVALLPQMPPAQSAKLALVLQDVTEPVPDAVPANYTDVISAADDQHVALLRIQGRTTYVSAAPGAPEPAPPQAQALVLTSLAAADNARAQVEKLANYVATGAADAPYYYPNLGAAAVPLALAAYDVQTSSAQPQLALRVRSAPTVLLETRFDGTGGSVASARSSWDALADPPAPLTFFATGRGQASVAAALTYVPAALPERPQFRGLQLTLAVRATRAGNATAVGPPLARAPLGAVLHVAATLTTPDALPSTLVRVLLAGGLEPVDSNLQSGGGGGGGGARPCVLPWYLDGLSFSPSWRPPCPRVETAAANVTHVLARVPPGTHELTFLAVAASPGKYTLPPALAFVEEQPELSGLSAGAIFTVCPSSDCGDE